MIWLRIISCCLLINMLSSCTDEAPQYEMSALTGQWTCVELFEGDQLQPLIQDAIRFSFKDDSTYTYHGGLYKESGTWQIKKDLLVTKAEDNMEKQVKILQLESDTLVLLMNDRGFEMKMILERQ
jgi:Lipocalin-like domain